MRRDNNNNCLHGKVQHLRARPLSLSLSISLSLSLSLSLSVSLSRGGEKQEGTIICVLLQGVMASAWLFCLDLYDPLIRIDLGLYVVFVTVISLSDHLMWLDVCNISL